jgi:phytoene dehydrogenase-like protein
MPHAPPSAGGDPDVLVVGAGPNGLVAACLLAEHGLRVLVLEAADEIGGAVKTAEVTLPGFHHDLFSAFYPLGVVGPIGDLPLAEHGLTWCGHNRPYGGGTATGPGAAIARSLESSTRLFDAACPGDGDRWRELFGYWSWGGRAFLDLLFHPLADPAGLLRGAALARSPQRLFEFVQIAAGSARSVGERFFRGEDARVWLAGSVLHSDLVPDDAGGGAFGLLLCGLAQQIGMPVPRGGARAIPEALRGLLVARGGEVRAGMPVEQIVVRRGRAVAVRTRQGEIRARRAILATVEPRALFLDLVGQGALPERFVRLVRRYRYGTGVFVLHCALSDRLPFRSETLRDTLVIHLAPSADELERGATAARRGVLAEHPLLIAGQHTLADPSRAPAGQHTLWVMTHVPSRIDGDQAGVLAGAAWEAARQPFGERVLDELEKYAPGARALVRATHAMTPDELEAANSNLVGGDIGSGSYTLDQQLVFRPVPGWFRYRTPVRNLYMSGAATHPGGGVHGAAGANAARVLLADLRFTRLGEQLASPVTRLRSVLGLS